MNFKITFYILLILFTRTSFAQIYSFVKTENQYEDLVGAISINNGEVWAYPSYEIDLGFNFYLFDTLINKVYFFDEGQGCTISSSVSADRFHKFIIPFGTGLIDRGYPTAQSLSPLSYKTSGEPGIRICKIEWKNAGFVGDYEENGFTHDYVNFQLWLYETSGLIEIHYGTSMISNFIDDFGATGPYIGLSPLYDKEEFSLSLESIWLGGDPQNPEVYISDMFVFLEGMMLPNTTYQFVNNLTIGNKEISLNEVILFPSPSKDFINIKVPWQDEKELTVQIYDLSGKIIYETILLDLDSNVTVPISDLAPGIYNMVLHTVKHIKNGKIIKTH